MDNNKQHFLNNCKYHLSGLIFQGNFDMPKKHFDILFKHYLDTNENLLNDYCDVIHLSWETENKHFYKSRDEINELENSISKIRELRILDFDIISDAKYSLKLYRTYLRWQEEKQYNKPRKDAQKFIGKRKIREFIFKRDKWMCLKCNSLENLTIDHIIPVNKSGKNKLSNLQTLCRSCNSSKSDKFKDYR